MNDEISGQVNGIIYKIDKSIIDRLKENHGIDAIAEIETALMQFETNKLQPESK